MIRLISTDFDGTIYEGSAEHPVDPGLLAHLAEAKARGAAWVINTGRLCPDLLLILASLKIELRPDFIVSVERNIHRRVKGGYEEHASWNRACREDHRALFEAAQPGVERVRRRITMELGAEFYHDEWSPLSIIAKSAEDADRIHDWTLEECERVPNLRIVRNARYFRFGHAGYSKGTALGEIARLLGLPPAAVFAAGDHFNDLSMLDGAHARHVAAPANAIDEVKEAVRRAGGHVSRRRCGRGVLDALRRLNGAAPLQPGRKP
ncbi:MAG: HAD hydrolase family protein [Verrucomicrobiae bacterium]|nr:HAD hydrolase family protein [Verrucomicrobiae bacterium]